MRFSELNALIRDLEVAMLTTVETDGILRSRPMKVLESRDGKIWFFSALSSPKSEEVQEDPRVNLSFADPESRRYVSLSGTCELVRDPQLARDYWRKEFLAWFPNGVEDPDLALLKVQIEQAELWDQETWSKEDFNLDKTGS